MKLWETNNHWNYWRLQFYWNKIEWVDQRNQDRTNNTFCTSTYKYYTKYGNESCYFVGHSEMKPIEYDVLFNRK